MSLIVRTVQLLTTTTAAIETDGKFHGSGYRLIDLDILNNQIGRDLALEALWIRDIKPDTNMKNKFKSRELIKV